MPVREWRLGRYQILLVRMPPLWVPRAAWRGWLGYAWVEVYGWRLSLIFGATT